MFNPTLKWFLTRTLLAYCIVVFGCMLLVDQKRAYFKRLDYITEWGNYPLALIKKQASFNERKLRMAIRFYKTVIKISPTKDDVNAMIGYCYTQLNENGRALKYYLRAKNQRPAAFWYDYNLGVIYYNLKDKQKAREHFKVVIDRPLSALEASAKPTKLGRLSGEQRRQLFYTTTVFVARWYVLSWQKIITIDFENKDYSAAFNDSLSAANNVDGDDQLVFLLYGSAAALLIGKWEDAVVCAQKALKIQPEQKWAKIFLTMSLFNLRGSSLQEEEKQVLEQFIQDSLPFAVPAAEVIVHPLNYMFQPGGKIQLL